jgi:hypothetical protein
VLKAGVVVLVPVLVGGAGVVLGHGAVLLSGSLTHQGRFWLQLLVLLVLHDGAKGCFVRYFQGRTLARATQRTNECDRASL